MTFGEYPEVLEVRAVRGLDLIARLLRRRKTARFWDSWAARDSLVLEIPRDRGWPSAQAIVSYEDARRLRDFIDRVLSAPRDSLGHVVSTNPLAHLTEDELIGGTMGTFKGHVGCADCDWIAEHEGRTTRKESQP